MADLSDVYTVLAGVIAGALYPDGTAAPSAAGASVKVFPGWPQTEELNRDLAQGTVTVSIYAAHGGMDRDTTRFMSEWEYPVPAPHTIEAATTGTTVTLSGTIATPQNVALIVNRNSYVHAVQPSDTLASIAAALAVQVSAHTPASSAGPVITIPGAFRLVARVGTTGIALKPLRQTDRRFQITVWAPTEPLRSVTASAIDLALVQIPFLAMPDGTAARLTYASSTQSDDWTKAGEFRRDLFYSVETTLCVSAEAVEIVVPELNTAPVSPEGASPAPPIRTYP